MKKINFALVSDSIFIALCAFLISFTLIRFYVKSALAALFIAIIPTVFALCFAFAVMYRKRAAKILLSSDESEKKTLALHLSVSSDSYITDLFLQALDGAYIAGNRLEDGEKSYFFFFRLSPLTPDDVAYCIRRAGGKKGEIFCCNAGAEALSLAEEFSINIKQIGEVYELLRQKSLLPEKYTLGKIGKVSVWKKISSRFNRKLSPTLFLCGLSLLFFSFFTLYRIYYIVFGALLLTLSAACVLISGKR